MPLFGMHLLGLEKNWQIYELVLHNGKKKDLRDLFFGLAPETFYRGGVVFLLKHSGRKIIFRPRHDGEKWLAQRLIIKTGGGEEWRTIGQFIKFDETRIQELKEEEISRKFGLI